MVNYKEWLRLAYSDIMNCKEIINNSFLTNIIAFHAQQAVEKSLKAILSYQGEKIPKTHSLNNLFELCKEYVNIDDPDIVNVLDEIYIESRYPGSMGLLPDGKPSLSDAGDFYIFAKEFFEKVCELLGVSKDELNEWIKN